MRFLPVVALSLLAGGVSALKGDETVAEKIVRAALFRTTQEVRYDPKYVVIGYPGGDVPEMTQSARVVSVVGTGIAQLGIPGPHRGDEALEGAARGDLVGSSPGYAFSLVGTFLVELVAPDDALGGVVFVEHLAGK